MSAGKGIVLSLAAVLATAGVAGCQSDQKVSNAPSDHTVTWLDNGMPYFEYADPNRNHYRFIYHPNSQFYYEPYTETYFWYEDGMWYEGEGHEVPKQCTIDLRIAKVIESPHPKPFVHHDAFVGAHPPRRHMPAGFDAREQFGMGLQMANADGTFDQPVEMVEVFDTFEILEMFERFETFVPEDATAEATESAANEETIEIVAVEPAADEAPADVTAETPAIAQAAADAPAGAEMPAPIEDTVEHEPIVLDDMWIVLPDEEPAEEGVPTADASEEDEEEAEEVVVVEAEPEHPEDD
jgi:hypothetical protein